MRSCLVVWQTAFQRSICLEEMVQLIESLQEATDRGEVCREAEWGSDEQVTTNVRHVTTPLVSVGTIS